MGLHRNVLLGIFLGLGSTTTACSAEFDYEKQPAFIKHTQCLKAYEYACFGYSSINNANVQAEPKENSKVLGRLHFGNEMAFLEPFESVEHPGWVMVGASRGDRTVIAWAPRSGVLFRWELHRVVGCWPVAMLSWMEEGAGEYDGGVFEPQFDVNGRVSGTNAYEREYYKDYAVYYAGGIFVIYRSADQSQLSPTFTLDYPKRHVTNNYLSIQKTKTGNPPYLFAKDEVLKGCTQIPKVDPSQPLLPKPTPTRN